MGKFQLLILQIIHPEGLILSLFFMDSKNSFKSLDIAPSASEALCIYYFQSIFLLFRLENFCFFVFKVNNSSIISHLLFSSSVEFFYSRYFIFFKSEIVIWFFFFFFLVSISLRYFLSFPSLQAFS